MKAFLSLLFLTFLCTGVRAQKTFPAPVNDIVPERTNLQRPPLAYAPLREADLLWQKTVWRVIDVREKINHAFTNPERPLVSILLEAANDEQLQLFSPIDDQFTTPLTAADRMTIAGAVDTIPVVDPNNPAKVTYRAVARVFNPATVTRYRLKEMWYVDKNSSQMKVRLLGIAPIVDDLDENGNVRYQRLLFWANYANSRPILARERAWVTANETAATSWEDVFEMRRFASYVTKEGNVHNRRIEDIHANGRDRLLASDRAEAERMGRESDLWSW